MTTQSTVQEIPHFRQFSADEAANVWYSSQELNKIMNEAKETTIVMQEGTALADDDTEVTPRGLEYMTPDGFDITTSSLDAVKLVLEEQQRQRTNSENDVELIAFAISSIARHRLRIAHLAAMKDARGVYGDGKFATDHRVVSRASRSCSVGRRESRRDKLRETGSSGRRRGTRRGSMIEGTFTGCPPNRNVYDGLIV
jgi:hypothetical protein